MALYLLRDKLFLADGGKLAIDADCCCFCLCHDLVQVKFAVSGVTLSADDCIQASSNTNDRININAGAGGTFSMTRDVSRTGTDAACSVAMASASIAGAGPTKRDFSDSSCSTEVGSSTSVRLDITDIGCTAEHAGTDLESLIGTSVYVYNNVGLGAMYLYGVWETNGTNKLKATNLLSGIGYPNMTLGKPNAASGGEATLEIEYA